MVLVLSRMKDERILIGDEIEVVVVDIRGDKVRLGITAPKSIPVHREEVAAAIARENALKGTQDGAEAKGVPGVRAQSD